MFSRRLRRRIAVFTGRLQKSVDRRWYPPLLGLLSALDNFVIVIPNDGLLVSSAMLTPKRWFWLACCITLGSTAGAAALAAAVELQGLEWILQVFPGIETSKTWIWTNDFFDNYGLIVVFLVAVTPIMQQPAIILASLAETPLVQLTLAIFTGRFIKFLIMAYVASHAPRLLNRLWGIKKELKEVGVQIK